MPPVNPVLQELLNAWLVKRSLTTRVPTGAVERRKRAEYIKLFKAWFSSKYKIKGGKVVDKRTGAEVKNMRGDFLDYEGAYRGSGSSVGTASVAPTTTTASRVPRVAPRRQGSASRVPSGGAGDPLTTFTLSVQAPMSSGQLSRLDAGHWVDIQAARLQYLRTRPRGRSLVPDDDDSDDGPPPAPRPQSRPPSIPRTEEDDPFDFGPVSSVSSRPPRTGLSRKYTTNKNKSSRRDKPVPEEAGDSPPIYGPHPKSKRYGKPVPRASNEPAPEPTKRSRSRSSASRSAIGHDMDMFEFGPRLVAKGKPRASKSINPILIESDTETEASRPSSKLTKSEKKRRKTDRILNEATVTRDRYKDTSKRVEALQEAVKGGPRAPSAGRRAPSVASSGRGRARSGSRESAPPAPETKLPRVLVKRYAMHPNDWVKRKEAAYSLPENRKKLDQLVGEAVSISNLARRFLDRYDANWMYKYPDLDRMVHTLLHKFIEDQLTNGITSGNLPWMGDLVMYTIGHLLLDWYGSHPDERAKYGDPAYEEVKGLGKKK